MFECLETQAGYLCAGDSFLPTTASGQSGETKHLQPNVPGVMCACVKCTTCLCAAFVNIKICAGEAFNESGDNNESSIY